MTSNEYQVNINNKNLLSINKIQELFSVQNSTVKRWFKNGLKHFVVNRVSYVFEDDLEVYFRNISK